MVSGGKAVFSKQYKPSRPMLADPMPEGSWRWIPGYEGVYDACVTGAIRSHRGKSPKILQPNMARRDGYLYVSLGRKNNRYVAHLILGTFDGPKPEGDIHACHYPDPDINNNAISNLMWDTRQANTEHRYIHDTVLFGERNPQSKLTWETVRQIRAEYGPNLPWWERRKLGYTISQYDLAKKYGVTQSVIGDIVRGISWIEGTDSGQTEE